MNFTGPSYIDESIAFESNPRYSIFGDIKNIGITSLCGLEKPKKKVLQSLDLSHSNAFSVAI